MAQISRVVTFPIFTLLGLVLAALLSSAEAATTEIRPDWCSVETTVDFVAEWPTVSVVSMSCGDLDEDGVAELIMTSLEAPGNNDWSSTLSVVFRSSDSRVSRTELRSVGGHDDVDDYPFGLLGYVCKPAVADLDGDGFQDIVVIRQGPASDLAHLPSVAEVWWGHGDREFTCTEIEFTAGPLASAQTTVQEHTEERNATVLVPLLSSNQILRLESSPRRHLGIAPILREPLPISPISVATADLSGDGVSDIVVAGFLLSSDSTVRRAMVVLYSEDDYAPETTTVFTFSEEESALSPISLFIADVDGDDIADIATTRRLDRSPEERLLPWSSHEEIIVIRGGVEGTWHVYPYPLWEASASAIAVFGIQADPVGLVQVFVILPDLRVEILDVRNMFVSSSCSISQLGIRDSCLVEEAGEWKLFTLVAHPSQGTQLRVWTGN